MKKLSVVHMFVFVYKSDTTLAYIIAKAYSQNKQVHIIWFSFSPPLRGPSVRAI